jgi:hypothetical protein
LADSRTPPPGGFAADRAGLAWPAWHLPHREYALLIPGYLAMGSGIGLTISPGTTDALGAAAPSERSQASGIVQTVRQVGAAVGIAVLGAIVANVGAVAPDATPAAHLTAQTNGVAAGYWAGAAMMALMAVVAFVFVRRRLAE